MTFTFEHSWKRDLPGSFLEHRPDPAPEPRLVVLNGDLAQDLGLDGEDLAAHAAQWFSGASLPPGAEPIALAYAGHQFGGFSPVLGDGRAHLLGEMITPKGRFDLQLKGSGRTPFSRGGDGKAAIGPMLREYLISEFMAAAGVPTTRSLAVVTTGQNVSREGGPLPGAVLARVAASHIRVGSFQFHAARKDTAKLRALLDYTIARHDPDLGPGDGLGLFERVVHRQAKLVAHWMGLGFIHGVLNTDNVALSGETIDYGPCAFMESYAPGTVFSSIDRQGRYAYANQPLLLGWNLTRLAEALLPLIDDDPDRAMDLANAALERIAPIYEAEWEAVMSAKLGLLGHQAEDDDLARGLLLAMEGQGADWTLTFRRLALATEADAPALSGLFADPKALLAWLPRWRARLSAGASERILAANPAVIPRNHNVEAALDAATAGDYAPFYALLAAIKAPFEEAEGLNLPAPTSFGQYVTYCGT
jgi:uncharacterized protein YdiU (UPF0061 family)